VITAIERPITYLITPGDAVRENFAKKRRELIRLIEAAVSAGVSLIQIREKALDTRSLFGLAQEAVDLTRSTSTQLLINDRVDVAVGAGADGVHLTSHSMPAADVRAAFGPEMIIAVSTHNTAEAVAAESGGADLIVFGPVFASPGKGAPTGLKALGEVCRAVDIPVIGLGGVDANNLRSVLLAGAAGIAGIRCFRDTTGIRATVESAALNI
jgi:thiamine-phosphate pyrophosphorylase